MSQYIKKIQFITKMDSSLPFNIKKLSNLIKDLHNHEKFDFPQQFGQISPLQLATLSVLNLQINESLDILKNKSLKPRAYFERKIFVISDKLRKVGKIVKIISSLSQFNDPRQQCLARFDTVSFYQQNSDYPLKYLNFLKGIFPLINVHKDNIPLYMPFYEKLESYHSSIGNPNWEIARANLDFIYRKEIMEHSGITEEQPWYLLLTGNKKIIQVYNRTSIEEVWACMYLLYMNSTLKPYKYVNPRNESSEQINLEKVVEVILKKLQNETNKEVSHLLSLILYVLTDNTDQLEKSFNTFQQQFKTYITFAQTDPESKRICSKWGLTNAMYCQLLHNLLDHMVEQTFQDETEYRKIQFIFDDSIRLTENLVDKAIPHYDFYLRICYSSNTKDGDKLRRAHENILSVLTRSLQKNTYGFPFPQYGYWEKEVLEPFSTCYLEKHPQKIIEVVKYLPKETAIWKLLTCEKLSNSDQFTRISECLQENKQVYIKQIQRKVNISESDYHGFLRLWEDFHQIVGQFDNLGDFRSQLKKVQKGAERLSQMLSMNINEEFKRRVYLPFTRSENILRAMNALIEGYEQVLPEMNENEKRTLVKTYLSILLDERIKTQLIGALRQQDATEFWKNWSLVYLTDQSLVDELIKSNQPIEDEEMENQMVFGIEEEGRFPPQHNHHEVMELQ